MPASRRELENAELYIEYVSEPVASTLRAITDEGMVNDVEVLRAVLDDADDFTLRCMGGTARQLRRAFASIDEDGVVRPLGALLVRAAMEAVDTHCAPRIDGIHILLALMAQPWPAADLLMAQGIRPRALRSMARRLEGRGDEEIW